MEYRKDYFHDISLAYEGKNYRLEAEDLDELATDYWQGPNDPSSWLIVSTVIRIRSKWRELPREKVIGMAAEVLGVTIDKIESSLDWNASYLAFHDALELKDVHAFPKEDKMN